MEAFTEPRFDEAEFERLKAGALASVQSQIAQPGYAARQAFQKVIYGADSKMARPTGGTIKSIESLTMQDMKDYAKKYFNPRLATIHVVGAVEPDVATKTFMAYNSKWTGPEVMLPKVDMTKGRNERVFFVDVPDSKQSVIYIGQPAPGMNSPDYYKLSVVNERLGGSGGARLFQQLREEKGYTYGAYSRVPKTNQDGYFQGEASSGAQRHDARVCEGDHFKVHQA